jgi:RNA polymerase sigma factor (sigma-70 family)
MVDPVRGRNPLPPGVTANDESASTLRLLARAREGDAVALNEVFARTGPALRKWARGRLPGWARDVADTDDLVQDTMIRMLKQIDVFEYRTDGALQAYLRQAVMNRIRNEIRRSHRHPSPDPLESDAPASDLSPLEELIGRESVEAYDRALDELSPQDREAVIGRVELGLSYEDLAKAMGRPSADAARMAVARALVKLARLLELHGSRVR